MANYSAEVLNIRFNGGDPMKFSVARPKGICGGCSGGKCGGCQSKPEVSVFKSAKLTTPGTKLGIAGSFSFRVVGETVRPVPSGEYCSEHGTIDNCSHKRKR